MTDRPSKNNPVSGMAGAASGYKDGILMNTEDSKRFWGQATFLKAPLLRDAPDATIGIVGIPFDGGNTRTPGSRFGPRGLREASFRVGSYNGDFELSPHEIHRLADCGDILINPFSITDTYESIQKGVGGLMDRGILPISIGGDHSVTLPLLRAMHAKHGKIGLIQFDAHCDVSEAAFGSPFHYGSMFRRAVVEGLVDPTKVIQVGIRKLYHPGEMQFARDNGFEVITARDLKMMGPGLRDTLREKFARLAGTKVYVSFDIDVVDQASAPGIGSPEPFGPTSYEAIEAVRALHALKDDLVGFDVVEVAPPYDQNNMTAYLGALVAYEFASIIPATVK